MKKKKSPAKARATALPNEAPSSGSVNMQFKLLSAIAIIIVVGGHCYHGGFEIGYEWFPTYSFNLALFVFISGYFYKDKYQDNPLQYIWQRIKRLIIPAYLWNIVYGLFVLFMKNFGYSIGAEVNWYNLFVMPFVNGEGFLYNLGSWFVYPLFCVCVINMLFRKLLSLLHLNNEYLIMTIYLIVGIIGVQLVVDNSTTFTAGVFKLMTRTMLFLPFYEFGCMYKRKLEKHDSLNSIAYFAILFAIQLILLTFFKELEYTPSSMANFKNGCIVPFISAATGIAFWLRISKLLTPVVKTWKFVRLISDNTYSIMIHQMFGFMVVKWIFYAISSVTPLFADFNVAILKSSIWYYYLPNGLHQYAIIYLAGGIFVPILIALIGKKVMSIFKENPSIKIKSKN